MRTTENTSIPHLRLSLSAATQKSLRTSLSHTQIYASVTAAFLAKGYTDPQVSVLSSEISLGLYGADYERFENASKGTDPAAAADAIINHYLLPERNTRDFKKIATSDPTASYTSQGFSPAI